jgi:hypothetical protein
VKALSFFQGYTLSQLCKDVTSWIWKYSGLDVQDATTLHDVLHPFHVALMELEGDGKLHDGKDEVSRRFGSSSGASLCYL